MFWIIFNSHVGCLSLYYFQYNALAKAWKWDLTLLLIEHFSDHKMHILWLSFPSWILKQILSPKWDSKWCPKLSREWAVRASVRSGGVWTRQARILEPIWTHFDLWKAIFNWFWVNSPLWTRQESIHYVPDYSEIAAVRKYSVPRQFGGHGGGTSAHAHWDKVQNTSRKRATNML